MSFLNWFRPKNKHNVVLPTTDSSKLIHGLELVKQFTTETEPKVADYPKTQYKVYWETLLDTVPGGYTALVRFYPFDGGTVKEVRVTEKDVAALKDAVNAVIRTTMNQNKR
jgi:hypothetical protein